MKRFGRLEVDNQTEFGWQHDPQFSWSGTLENPPGVYTGLAKRIGDGWP